uniref:Transcription and mRNA export factor ENY2 n=1 Tax=Ursus maritimus TaxID=29073 RepID=A0A452V2F6_URSMA
MVVSKMNKDAQMRAAINQKLIETGERERSVFLCVGFILKQTLPTRWQRLAVQNSYPSGSDYLSPSSSSKVPGVITILLSLKELLRAKLIECGWKDQLKAHCKEVIKEKGLEHVTVDDLVAEITPKGRALVPDSVKKELLQRIRTFLAQHASL